MTNSLRAALTQAAEQADGEALRVILGLETTPNGRAYVHKAHDSVTWPPLVLLEDMPDLEARTEAYHATCARYGIAGRPIVLQRA